MKRLLFGAALLLVVFMPLKVSAEARIESVLVRRMSDQVNVRVTLQNPTRVRQPGPVVVDLFIRADESQGWEKIKTWDNIQFIQPGYRVARDFFGDNSALLRQMVSGGRFQVKTSVRAPGMAESAEVTSWSDNQTGR